MQFINVFAKYIDEFLGREVGCLLTFSSTGICFKIPVDR